MAQSQARMHAVNQGNMVDATRRIQLEQTEITDLRARLGQREWGSLQCRWVALAAADDAFPLLPGMSVATETNHDTPVNDQSSD